MCTLQCDSDFFGQTNLLMIKFVTRIDKVCHSHETNFVTLVTADYCLIVLCVITNSEFIIQTPIYEQQLLPFSSYKCMKIKISLIILQEGLCMNYAFLTGFCEVVAFLLNKFVTTVNFFLMFI